MESIVMSRSSGHLRKYCPDKGEASQSCLVEHELCLGDGQWESGVLWRLQGSMTVSTERSYRTTFWA